MASSRSFYIPDMYILIYGNPDHGGPVKYYDQQGENWNLLVEFWLDSCHFPMERINQPANNPHPDPHHQPQKP